MSFAAGRTILRAEKRGFPTEVDPRIGSELAGYRIEALLRRDGLGAVYRSEDVRLRQRVALGIVEVGLAADEGFRERVLRESLLAAALEHPGVVRVREAGEVAGRLFVATAHVEGTDLEAVLTRVGRLEPERALAIADQLAVRWTLRGWHVGSCTER